MYASLRERRGSQHALDVVLHDREQRGAERGDRRDDADGREHPLIGLQATSRRASSIR